MSEYQVSFFQDSSPKQTWFGKKINCLYNGEYGEHTSVEMNITDKQLDRTLKIQNESYAKYEGKIYGDFKVKKIEYDWGVHKQIWTVQCLLCGEISKKEDGYYWSRGKGLARTCHCRRDKRVRDILEQAKTRDEQKEEREKELRDEIGRRYGNYEVIECEGFGDRRCKIKCTVCGCVRTKFGINKLRNGQLPKCNCTITHKYAGSKYAGSEYIGVRHGHLTSVSVNGGYVLCKCDCGRERQVNTTTFFKYHAATYCGNSDCEYANERQKKSNLSRKKGADFEVATEFLLHANGYKTKYVGQSGDYGVDIIATDADGRKIAVQCKCNSHTLTSVNAIQEVYAGGRYYGLEHFAVVAYGEVSKNAIKMANVLGVYISDGKTFEYPDNIREGTVKIIENVRVRKNVQRRKLYEINGEWKTLDDWAYLYGTNAAYVREGLKKGLTFETSLNYKPGKKVIYTVRDFTGSVSELCYHFGVVSPQSAVYRLKRGWDPERAILTPPTTPGRKRKAENIEEQMTMFSVAQR